MAKKLSELSPVELEMATKLQNGVGISEALAPMIKNIMEAILDGEMSGFISQKDSKEKHNRRNGNSYKQIKSSSGNFELETPRDRLSEFEPQLIKKRQTHLPSDIENKILSLYINGVSYSDIQSSLKDLYHVEIAKSTISTITDNILDELKEWRSRPLNNIYPIVFMDAIHFKVRENSKVITKAGYTLLGINEEGKREILGLYLSESEGASFWAQVLADLKNRGLKDILIACVDGLKGFSEAILAHFPNCEVQRCIIHQIRYSCRYITNKDSKEFMKDLKLIYRAPNKACAEEFLQDLDIKWSKKYQIVINSWRNNWEELSTYFKYDETLRKLIYTTNMIENLHRNIRKYTKSKGAFTSLQALEKAMFCAFRKSEEKYIKAINNWGLIISQLDIHFPNRLNLR